MNKLFLILIAVLTCLSCTSKGEFTVKGTATKDFEGKTIYLMNQREDGVENIDSTIIKSGKFTFKGIQETPTIYVLSFQKSNDNDSENEMSRIIYIEQGKIDVDIKADNDIKVSGNAVNDAFQKKSEAEMEVYKQLDALQQKYANVNPTDLSEAELEKINSEFMAIDDSVKDINLKFAIDNINNKLGEGIFLSIANRLSVDEMEQVMNNAGEEFKSKETGKAILEMISGMKKVAEGQKYSDFTMFDPAGKEISLSDYAGKGKYVLIDFWASWCGPCIKEMPTLVEAYKLYKNKNFEIVGVSLDAKAEPWKAAIQKYNMTWPQMSDLRQWDTQARVIYNFSSIPHTVLLDPDGIIIAKNLRGTKLLDKLQTLVK